MEILLFKIEFYKTEPVIVPSELKLPAAILYAC
jgi:hypothetical protein